MSEILIIWPGGYKSFFQYNWKLSQIMKWKSNYKIFLPLLVLVQQSLCEKFHTSGFNNWPHFKRSSHLVVFSYFSLNFEQNLKNMIMIYLYFIVKMWTKSYLIKNNISKYKRIYITFELTVKKLAVFSVCCFKTQFHFLFYFWFSF